MEANGAHFNAYLLQTGQAGSPLDVAVSVCKWCMPADKIVAILAPSRNSVELAILLNPEIIGKYRIHNLYCLVSKIFMFGRADFNGSEFDDFIRWFIVNYGYTGSELVSSSDPAFPGRHNSPVFQTASFASPALGRWMFDTFNLIEQRVALAGIAAWLMNQTDGDLNNSPTRLFAVWLTEQLA